MQRSTKINNRRQFTSSEVKTFVSKLSSTPPVLSHGVSVHPRISVIVPSYNQGNFLERTLLSILNQNYPNIELIVIDGGSTDNSTEVINKYERFMSYWISEPDDGQPSAINKGFAMATGDLIGWQNSDDLYLPGFFHAMAESLEMEPKAQLFTANVYIIDENDRIIRRTHFTPFSQRYLIYQGWNLSSQATLMTRELIDKVGAIREDIQVGFDWDWFIRAGNVVKQTVLHRSVGGCYRIHSNSKLSRFGEDFRRPIYAQILLSHGIRVTTEVSLLQQNRLWRRLLRMRHFILAGLLYYPINDSASGLQGSLESMAQRAASLLRPLVLWALSKVGRTRVK